MKENKPMATIVDETEKKIQAGLFNKGEYENIRKRIKENKAPGPNKKKKKLGMRSELAR